MSSLLIRSESVNPTLPLGSSVVIAGEFLRATHGRLGVVVRHHGELVEVACWPCSRRLLPAWALTRLEVTR